MVRAMPDPQPQPPRQSRAHRRSDAGKIRLQARDINGLNFLAEQYAAPYDLLAIRLGTSEIRLRGIISRWRGAGLIDTGRLSEGPMWAWLTPAGMRQVGHKWEATTPPLARLAHIRAVQAARIYLESGRPYAEGRAWWRCERRLREGRPAGHQGHVADAEVIWPQVEGSPRAGETWAIEVELTAKSGARTIEIMAALIASPVYTQVLYLCAPSAIHVVTEAAARFDQPEQPAPVVIRALPPIALMGGER
jgi:hypothetical protein